jgi:hypothetical protein
VETVRPFDAFMTADGAASGSHSLWPIHSNTISSNAHLILGAQLSGIRRDVFTRVRGMDIEAEDMFARRAPPAVRASLGLAPIRARLPADWRSWQCRGTPRAAHSCMQAHILPARCSLINVAMAAGPAPSRHLCLRLMRPVPVKQQPWYATRPSQPLRDRHICR